MSRIELAQGVGRPKASRDTKGNALPSSNRTGRGTKFPWHTAREFSQITKGERMTENELLDELDRQESFPPAWKPKVPPPTATAM